jgi:hypothetical protein
MPIISCTNCGKPVSSEAENCIHCKQTMTKTVPTTNDSASVTAELSDLHNMLGDAKIDRYRYPALRFIAGVYLVLSVLAVICAFVVGVLIGEKLGAPWGILYFIITLFFALLILAISESIKVFLDIEYNTRTFASELKRRLK